MFLKSIDLSGTLKTIYVLLRVFDHAVEGVQPQNIVQFITDNATNCRATGKKMAENYR